MFKKETNVVKRLTFVLFLTCFAAVAFGQDGIPSPPTPVPIPGEGALILVDGEPDGIPSPPTPVPIPGEGA
jgi:hypothetical protein